MKKEVNKLSCNDCSNCKLKESRKTSVILFFVTLGITVTSVLCFFNLTVISDASMLSFFNLFGAIVFATISFVLFVVAIFNLVDDEKDD